MQLICPVCKSPLHQQGKNLSCDNRHSFDAARQGYWNLLLAHKKRSKDPGDNSEMVQARRQFLDQGHYAPLAAAVSDLALSAVDTLATPNMLDMGCGEGYYTHYLHQQFLAAGKTPNLIGLDISKHAVKAACRRSHEICWLVASGADIPLPESSIDLLLVLFSRLMPEAFAKPLKPGAHLLVAWPGEDHLIELRRLIYKEIRPSQFDPAETLASHFETKTVQRLNYTFTLNSAAEIATLLAMTPHGQRLSTTAKEQLIQQQQLTLTLDVNLGLFTRL